MSDNDAIETSRHIDSLSYWSQTRHGRSRFSSTSSPDGWNVLFMSVSVLSERCPGFPEDVLSEL